MPTFLDPTEFLTLSDIILDVRSPGEYAQGHVPEAVSFPLFSDEERAQVGICYKHQGRNAAVELGFAIAGPKFAGFIAQARELAGDRRVRMYCWRGGMRSEAVSWVLEMAGFQVSLLVGGYKAFRRWVLEMVQEPRQILILGGMTGTGKTAVLHQLLGMGEQVLDLEHLASHRGSSYGSLGMPPQPSTEHFENQIALAWAQSDPNRPLWIEAESKRVGTCRIPEPIFQQMDQAPVVELVRSLQERLTMLVEDYGFASTEALVTATQRIRKRLGGLRTQQAVELLQQRHLKEAFAIILEYYDKTYRYDLSRRSVTIYPISVEGLDAAQVAQKLLKVSQSFQEKPSETILNFAEVIS